MPCRQRLNAADSGNYLILKLQGASCNNLFDDPQRAVIQRRIAPDQESAALMIGVASAAVPLFLHSEPTRPLAAFVAKHNLPSIRVLEKSGFTRAVENPGDEELVYVLTN